MELLSAKGGKFEMNQLLFVDDTALVADSEEKLFRLVSEFGKRKLRVNVSKSKVMRCSRYGNGGRTHMLQNGETLGEVDCFKDLGSQVAADRLFERDVVHRMNEGYKAWVALKCVFSNRRFGIKAEKCLCEEVIVPTALHGAEAWGMRSDERRKVNVLEMKSVCLYAGRPVGLSAGRFAGLSVCWSVCRSVCMLVGLSVCLYAGRSVCLYAGRSVGLCLLVGLSVFLSAGRSVGLSVCWSVCWSVCLLAVCRSVCMLVGLSVCYFNHWRSKN